MSCKKGRHFSVPLRSFALAVLLALSLAGIVSITKPVIAHASGGGNLCSLNQPCVSNASDLSQSCTSSDGSPCLAADVSALSSDNNGSIVFNWLSSYNSPISTDALDHYHIHTSFSYAQDTNNDSENEFDLSASEANWSLDSPISGAVYSVQVQECDSSNNCSSYSQFVTVDTGYSLPSDVNAPGPQPACSQFYRVSGSWPKETYYMSDCLIQAITQYKVAVSYLPTVFKYIVGLLEIDCPECQTAVGLAAKFINYNIDRINQVDNECNNTGIYIDVYGVFWHYRAVC